MRLTGCIVTFTLWERSERSTVRPLTWLASELMMKRQRELNAASATVCNCVNDVIETECCQNRRRRCILST